MSYKPVLYTILGLSAVGIAGYIAYTYLKAKAAPPPAEEQPPPPPPPQPPPPPAAPSIITDKLGYRVGETIRWTASGLTVGQQYIVGAVKDGVLYYAPSRDMFYADSSTRSGEYYVGDNIRGATMFALCDSSARVLAKATITVV